MPLQIMIAIDPSSKIRKLIQKSRGKNKSKDVEDKENLGTDKKDEDAYENKDCITSAFVKEETGHTQTYEVPIKYSKNNEEFQENDEEFVDDILNDPLVKNEHVKNGMGGCFRRFFNANKKKNDELKIEPLESDIDTFNNLLEDGPCLYDLVGKEFTLNTTVTIKGVEDEGRPNLLLSGTIPFQFTSLDGVVENKVKVEGKLYSPRKNRDGTSSPRISTQSIDVYQVNKDFKPDWSATRKVEWLVSEVFTQEEYARHRMSLRYRSTIATGETHKKKGESSTERLEQTYISDYFDKDESLNIIERRYKKTRSRRPRNHPVTSITITRSKTRLIKFRDGTDRKEKVGRNVVTLAAPKGIIYFPGGGEMEDGILKIIRNDSFTTVESEDKVLERTCFRMTKDTDYTFDKSLKTNVFQDVYSPHNDFIHLLKDGYNPLTWLYNNYNKTKSFIQEFHVTE